nr:MAG TPA: hypothetical protein [Bacteriophage sp.]
MIYYLFGIDYSYWKLKNISVNILKILKFIIFNRFLFHGLNRGMKACFFML